MTSTDLYGTDAGGRLVVRRVRVRVADGPDAGEEATLQQGSLVVGTSPSVDVRLADRRVSRAHVEIAITPGGVWIRDLDSSNGTFIGTTRVESVVVQPPVELRVGDTRVQVLPDDVSAPALPEDRRRFGPLVAESLAMRRVFAMLELVASSDVPVVLEGETGVGKTQAALAIHRASHRSSGPLQLVDVGGEDAARADLLDVIRSASGGTVLLERVHRMSRETMTLLRSALDAAEQKRWDVRILATSEEDTRELTERGTLPRDLFFRIAGVRIGIPPLRERPEDVPVLVRALAAELRSAGDVSLSSEEVLRVRAHEMPGNVRQLRNLVEHAIVSAARGETRKTERVARDETGETPPPAHEDALLPAAGLTFKDAKDRVLNAFEREYVRDLLERHGHNLASAAREAGVVRHHLHALARKHGLR